MNLENYQDIFEPFENLVEIEVLGVSHQVPENNTLLRGFQFLAMKTVSLGDFCWNGDCANCQVWVNDPANEKPILACRTKVFQGMEIVRMNEKINLTEDEK